MKKTYKVISLLLVLVTVLGLFAACKKDNGGEETPTDPAPIDAVEFKLIRAEDADKTVRDAMVTLHGKIKEICGKELTTATDLQESTIDPNTSEILVGNTNRRIAEGLRSADFRVVREGNKIYLLGGSSSAVAEAVNYFAANYLSAQGITIADGRDYVQRGEYKFDALYFGDTKIETIKYFHILRDSEVTAASDELVATIKNKTDIDVQYVSSEAEANLVYDEKNDKQGTGKWGTVTENGKLYIVGGSSSGRLQALEYVKSKFESADKELRFENGTYSQDVVSEQAYLEESRLQIYPEFPEAVSREYTYSVTVTQGNKNASIPVYNHVAVSPKSENYEETDNFRRFANFAFNGERVRVDIKVKQDFDSYSVMPSEKNFEHSFNSETGVISVYLDDPDYFIIRLDGSDKTMLSILADKTYFPYDDSVYSKDTIRITDWYETPNTGGILTVTEANKTVYIAPGAVFNARLTLKGEGSRVCGRGAIIDPYSNIFEYDISKPTDNWILRLDADNITLDGILMLDSRGFNVSSSKAKATIKNIKILSSVISSDGIGLTALESADSLVENCFVYCGDNAIVFSAQDFTCRNITIGTTCAALYAQGSPSGVFEEIHVFRADTSDGALVRNIYNPSKKEQSINITVDGLYALDCTRFSRIVYAGGIGNLEKQISLSNVHVNALGEGYTAMGTSDNGYNNTAATGNYGFTLKNFAIGGRVIASQSEITTDFLGTGSANTVTYSKDESFAAIERDSTTVNYKATDKVFVGSWQVFFSKDIKRDGDVFLLPAEQIAYELRFDGAMQTVEDNGAVYIRSDKLVECGMAEAVALRDGVLYITPSKAVENILLPDSGEISNYMESWASRSNLIGRIEDDTLVYKLEWEESTNYGILRIINEEIGKYGAGKYKLTFSVQSTKAGFVRASVNGDSEIYKSGDLYLKKGWTTHTVEFEIDEADLSAPQISLKFNLASNSNTLPYFEISNIILTKV